MPNTENLSRMSNTAEILTKQFREAMRQSHLHDLEGADSGWQWKRFKEEALNFFIAEHHSSHRDHHRDSTKSEGSTSNVSAGNHGGGVNELFPKYRMRLQNNFFVSLLILNILFNGIVIVVALLEKADSKQPGILFLNGTSLIIFSMFLVISYIDEHLLRPRFSRTLASVTVLMTMIFVEYGNELLQLQLDHAPYLTQRIRPIIYIIIATHILLPFPSLKSAVISTVVVTLLEIVISFRQRYNAAPDGHLSALVKLTISDIIFYLYAALFGMYMSRLLEIIIKRAFENHHKYIKSKFNFYQEQEQQERLLNSCFPRHLIEDVRKDLKDSIRDEENVQNGKIIQSPFKKLYVKKYDNVSILYADIVNSMLLTSKLSANELVETLNDMFGSFDECADKNNCLRIKLLGDCYYCVSGLPKYDSQHALNCIRMGLDMIDIINEVRKVKNININMRIGIHSGMVLSGIIGVHKWQFDIWSQDSILASNMEHDGVPGYVHVTRETLDLVHEIALQKYIIEERNVNERLGYLISRKKKSSSMEQLERAHTFTINNRIQAERLRENVNKLRRRSSFSTIRLQNLNLFQESSVIKKEVDRGKENTFIDQEVEQMPLSFKSSVFKSLHGIHPLFLTFKSPKRIQSSAGGTGSSDDLSSNSGSEKDSIKGGKGGGAQSGEESSLTLEKEFLTLSDDFFIFYLSFSLVLCVVIGLVKGAIVPKVDSLIATLVIFATSIGLIVVCIYYSYSKLSSNLSFIKRNLIWFGVSAALFICSLHDIILYDCDEFPAEEAQLPLGTNATTVTSENTRTNWPEGPYLWSYTNCVILAMTGVSVFIRINLWLKTVLHFVGLISFCVLLLNECSLYQKLIPHSATGDQWVSNIGFDPTFSHFYYVFMVVSILCIIDRQVEYIFRLDFKLSKRLEDEDQESRVMGEINEILLKNILPAYVAQKFLNNSLISDDFYSESYEFCAVMFASIPNYSEFYSENEFNDNGIKCLQLLNEIICDFDQHLSDVRFLRIEKIKTIGSTYMAAAGLQPGRGSNGSTTSFEDERSHVLSILRFSIKLMETLKTVNKDALQDFKLRIGIAVGPVIAGIVGASKPQYDIWGDTVNVASRMESTGVIGRIQMTCETAQILAQTDHYHEFTLEQRGPIQVKGKGNLVTYLVKSKFDFEEKEITYV